MRLTFADLNASLDQHTVEIAGGGVVAGFLVRCTGSRKELGYIWSTGNVWRWRTADRAAWGERSTQRKAVEALTDSVAALAGTARRKSPATLPFDGPTDAAIMSAWRSATTASRPAKASAARVDEPARKAAAPAPKPAAPVQHIVWPDSNAHDLTAATSAALNKKRGGSR